MLHRACRRLLSVGRGDKVRIVEVGPRDGLQNEPSDRILPVHVKREFVQRLAGSGLQTIEIGSFVSPKWVPQMANTGELLKALDGDKGLVGVRLPALVPNLKGLGAALATGSGLLNEVSVFTAASESFCRKNINMTIGESLDKIGAVVKEARRHDLPVRGYVSTVAACPYEGRIEPERVLQVARELLHLGCYEVSLGDTIGAATPGQVMLLLDCLLPHIETARLAVHFHDTYGQALANILVALTQGIRVVDSAAAGLGGCPYAPGASGNVATEDVLYMLEGLGFQAGVDFAAVAEAGAYITSQLGRPNRSKAGTAWLAKKARTPGP